MHSAIPHAPLAYSIPPVTVTLAVCRPDTVLIIAKELHYASSLRNILRDLGYIALVRCSVDGLLRDIQTIGPEAIVLDPEEPGMAVLLRVVRRKFPDIQVVAHTLKATPVGADPDGREMALENSRALGTAAMLRAH